LFVVALPAMALGDAGNVVVPDRIPAKAGKTVTIFKNKDFRVTGTCEDNGGGDFTANTFLQARRDNLAYTTYGAPIGTDDFQVDFDRSDGRIDFTTSDATGTTTGFEEAEYYEFYAEGRGGRVLRAHTATSVHMRGKDCGFSGAFVQGAGSGPVKTLSRKKVDAGGSATLLRTDDFKITGSCVANGDDLTASVQLQARRRHLIYYLTDLDQQDTDFGPGDGAIEVFSSTQVAGGAQPDFVGNSFYNDVFAVGRGGTILQGRIGTMVHAKGADCAYSGTFIGAKSGGHLRVRDMVEAKPGKSVKLYENEDFKVTGTCVNNGGGDLTADTFVKAKRGQLAFSAYNGNVYGEPNFGPEDGRADITGEDATGTLPDFYSEDQYSDFWGEGRGGDTLQGRVAEGVHIRGAACTFAGFFFD
jgi:hypothetical protein